MCFQYFLLHTKLIISNPHTLPSQFFSLMKNYCMPSLVLAGCLLRIKLLQKTGVPGPRNDLSKLALFGEHSSAPLL